jgi:ABC-type molybdate transport system permease subunit
LITDWASASIHHAAWELVACDDAQLAFYLEAYVQNGGTLCLPLFIQRFRAAVIWRMTDFVNRIVESLGQEEFAHFAIALPYAIDRLIAAATWSPPSGMISIALPIDA